MTRFSAIVRDVARGVGLGPVVLDPDLDVEDRLKAAELPRAEVTLDHAALWAAVGDRRTAATATECDGDGKTEPNARDTHGIIVPRSVVDSGGASLNSPATNMASYLFSSESVTEGHPDKLCDQRVATRPRRVPRSRSA